MIGAWGNSRTAIRKRTQNYPDLNNEETPDILIPEVPLKVVITITDGKQTTPNRLVYSTEFNSFSFYLFDFF